MSLARALATKRCFADILQEPVFLELEKYLKNRNKRRVPDRLTIICIKAVMMQKILDDPIIKLLFDMISGTKMNKYRNILEISRWEADQCRQPEKPLTIKAAFQSLFAKPVPVPKVLTLKNDPAFMAAVMEQCLEKDGYSEVRILIRREYFRVELRVHSYGRRHTVVEAKYAHGLKYSIHWPFIFARIAFVKSIYSIRICLEADKKQPKERLEDAMNSLVEKVQKGPEREHPSKKRSDKYTMETNYTEERILEVVFCKQWYGSKNAHWDCAL